MATAGVSADRLARETALDGKTIQRWLNGETTPQLRNARVVAEALGCEPQDLWPDVFAVLDPPSAGTVPVSAYASRAEIPVQLWDQHFSTATEQIDVCVYGGTFLFDAIPDFSGMLGRAAAHGARIRFLVGDPHSASVRRRGHEEGIGDSLTARCQLTLARLRGVESSLPIEIRVHSSTLYVSQFRADDTLIANHHIHGVPASDNPAFVINRASYPTLWAKYAASYDAIWSHAQPPVD